MGLFLLVAALRTRTRCSAFLPKRSAYETETRGTECQGSYEDITKASSIPDAQLVPLYLRLKRESVQTGDVLRHSVARRGRGHAGQPVQFKVHGPNDFLLVAGIAAPLWGWSVMVRDDPSSPAAPAGR